MPLYILLALVVGGIAVIGVLLHGLGKSRLTVLNRDSARAAWRRHFPGDDLRAVTIAANGHAALVETASGPGLLWSFGADTVARHLRDFELKSEPDRLCVNFHDFTAPRVTLHLTDAERRLWQKMMAPHG